MEHKLLPDPKKMETQTQQTETSSIFSEPKKKAVVDLKKLMSDPRLAIILSEILRPLD